jgi:hypothetical protein
MCVLTGIVEGDRPRNRDGNGLAGMMSAEARPAGNRRNWVVIDLPGAGPRPTLRELAHA